MYRGIDCAAEPAAVAPGSGSPFRMMLVDSILLSGGAGDIISMLGMYGSQGWTCWQTVEADGIGD